MKLILLIAISLATKAYAFPEMIRHHYVNCTACHFSPSGGGLLTPYGRTISSEVLSTWGTEKEARSFYGALDNEKLNQWLQVGGNVRALQFHHESANVKEGRTIPMQAGIELAVTVGKWTVDLFYGKLNSDWKVEPIATRYYIMYQILDELTVRAGRFIPVFGLNIPQHTMVTRANLGFNQGTERDALEGMWSGEKWNFVSTVSKSVKSASVSEVETAMTAQLNYTIADSYRVGASYWLGTSDTQNRQILGLHAVLGFTERFFILAEADYQNRHQATTQRTQYGLYQFSKYGYEFYKGIHAQFVQEYSQSDFSNDKSKFESYGPGFLFYPRPHFEFEGLYTKKKISIVGDDFEDYAYLMIHYYF
ncbi:hypothetical protein ACLWBD_16800 [Bdellovibrio sp. HCB117]|uniref:hypothetical protein n=1 Tax=Bdellovibrio sp. HCB117 TaxID=3394359 RepID=UPI0039B394D4